jgi:hypothetical protein
VTATVPAVVVSVPTSGGGLTEPTTDGNGLGKPTASLVGGSLASTTLRNAATPSTSEPASAAPAPRSTITTTRPQPPRDVAAVAAADAFAGWSPALRTTRAWLQFGADQLAARIELHTEGAKDFRDGDNPDAATDNVELSGAGAVRVVSTALGAGTVWWALRAGGLMTSLLVVLPTWRHVDLMAVLPDREDDDDDWDRDAGPQSTSSADDEFNIDEQAVQGVLEPTADRSIP